MQPPDDFDPPIGEAEVLEPGLRRIVAPNPSPMTYRGTNTYLLGDREIAVIEPGNRQIWASEAETSRQGDVLVAVSDLFHQIAAHADL